LFLFFPEKLEYICNTELPRTCASGKNMKKKNHSSPMRFVSSGENKTNLKDAHTQKQATQHCLKITPKHMTEKKHTAEVNQTPVYPISK
jgi:hypothetical protein